MQCCDSQFDVLVIGGGPAGLAATMALGRACRTVAVFDSQEYRNEEALLMHNVLCHDGQKPSLYRAQAVQEIMDKYDTVCFFDREIISASARKTDQDYPQIRNIEGYKELWGRGIVHCLFCDGYEKRGGRVGVLGQPSMDDLDSVLLAFPLAHNDLTIFTNGAPYLVDPDARQPLDIAIARGVNIDGRAIKLISQIPDGTGVKLCFHDGEDKDLRMLLSSPKSINRAASLVEELGLETQPRSRGLVVSKSSMGESSLRGCFVAGDASSSVPKIVPTALASRSLAGIGAAKQLAYDDALEAFQKMAPTGDRP
ncbi:FAD/NAD(P)-binding domain-containing protein [Aspergillus niger]|nr:FAD/NAD(P)-binding domain-containing protein [Aspergillus niger]